MPDVDIEQQERQTGYHRDIEPSSEDDEGYVGPDEQPRDKQEGTPSCLEPQQLRRIRKQATSKAGCPGMNPTWQRAYLALADATNYLDAMKARCTVSEAPAETEEKG